jgi:hypothetical protein
MINTIRLVVVRVCIRSVTNFADQFTTLRNQVFHYSGPRGQRMLGEIWFQIMNRKQKHLTYQT